MRVLTRFNRTGQPPDIELAIQCFTQATDEAPPSSIDKSIIMVNLSNVYRSQYTIRPAKEELRRPLDLIKEAYLVNLLDSDLRALYGWMVGYTGTLRGGRRPPS
jgi:hypothetical protein